MNARPLYDRVVVRKIEHKAETKGGIIIPETHASAPQLGRVVSVGPGKNFEGPGTIEVAGEEGPDGFPRLTITLQSKPCAVKVGDYVLYGKYNGSEIIVNDETLYIFREDELAAVLEGYEEPATNTPAE